MEINKKTLCIKDLNKTLREIHREILKNSGIGISELYYEDDYDFFKIILQETNLGYDVCVFLNGSKVFSNTFYEGNTLLGDSISHQIKLSREQYINFMGKV